MISDENDFAAEIKKVKESFLILKTKRDIWRANLASVKITLAEAEKKLLATEKARVVAQKVASEIQETLEFQISNIVTMALASVFADPYEFKVKFVDRRNQTECDMFFVKNGNECEPLDASGFGAVDIASIALRMAVWSLKNTRNIQILDEPSRDLSRDMQDKCSEMLKLLSTELGIQMIVVSHIPEMITAADRIINVENIDGYSKVTIL